MVEDYEDSDHMDHSTEEEDSTLSEPASQDEPANLFTSATGKGLTTPIDFFLCSRAKAILVCFPSAGTPSPLMYLQQKQLKM